MQKNVNREQVIVSKSCLRISELFTQKNVLHPSDSQEFVLYACAQAITHCLIWIVITWISQECWKTGQLSQVLEKSRDISSLSVGCKRKMLYLVSRLYDGPTTIARHRTRINHKINVA